MMQRWLAALAALALAGCSASEQVPDGISVNAKGDALPTVHGLVVDAAIRPMAGVEVRFLGTRINATTDANGEYEIHQLLQRAEAVLISAFKAGYVPRAQQVQVSGSVSVRIDFTLDVDPEVIPRTEILQHRGTVRCDSAVTVAGQATRTGCEPDKADGEDVLPSWMWDVTPTPGVAGLVVELHWEPATAASERLHGWLKAPMAGGQGGEVTREATGTSPLRFEITADQARSFNRWVSVRLHVELAEGAGPVPGASAGAAVEQFYDAYATVFYVNPAPGNYTLG